VVLLVPLGKPSGATQRLLEEEWAGEWGNGAGRWVGGLKPLIGGLEVICEHAEADV